MEAVEIRVEHTDDSMSITVSKNFPTIGKPDPKRRYRRAVRGIGIGPGIELVESQPMPADWTPPKASL